MSWHFWLSDKTIRKFAELPTYYQRQKCSPGILFASKVRFICIFMGFAGVEGASNESGVVVNGNFRFFRSLYLPNLHIQDIQGHHYYMYIVPWSPLVALRWHRNRWPWMALNDHFALKYVSVTAFGWRSGFRRKLFGNFSELRIYCRRQKFSSATVLVIQMLWRYSLGSPKRRRQSSELYSHSQFSHMLFTDVGRK